MIGNNSDEVNRVLITGVNGFVGSHMAEECLRRGWTVHGIVRGFRSNLENIEHLISRIGFIYHCDITDSTSISDVVAISNPDIVFHLAAQSFVPDSWSAPRQTIDANVIGTLNLLEAIRRFAPKTRIQCAGSSEEYGRVSPSECPITEESRLRPLSPYGVSKVASDLLVRQYHASYGIHSVVTRAFNHSGPRRGQVFAESDWCRQVALAEASLGPAEIRHGNLEAVRDYTDVRDIVRGYIDAVRYGDPGDVYQLTSGNGIQMQTVLDEIVSLSKVKIACFPDEKRMRPSDVPILNGTSRKAFDKFAWCPTIPIETTFRDLLGYWREKVKKDFYSRCENDKCSRKLSPDLTQANNSAIISAKVQCG